MAFHGAPSGIQTIGRYGVHIIPRMEPATTNSLRVVSKLGQLHSPARRSIRPSHACQSRRRYAKRLILSSPAHAVLARRGAIRHESLIYLIVSGPLRDCSMVVGKAETRGLRLEIGRQLREARLNAGHTQVYMAAE